MKISIEDAIQKLNDGQVVAIPTETVYGLGAIATNASAVSKIFQIKNRPSNNPLICHIDNIDNLSQFVHIEDEHRDFFQFWPGPLTILFKKKDIIPSIVTAGSDLCAFRIPDHIIFSEILKKLKKPIAAPSANPSGKLSPVNAEMIIEYFGNTIDVVDGGDCNIGLESTVIQVLSKKTIKILRHGILTKEFFSSYNINVIEDNHILPVEIENQKGLLSPGLLPKHYAPKKPLVLLESKLIHYFYNTKNPLETLLEILKNHSVDPPTLDINNLKNRSIGFLIYGPINSFNNIINLSYDSNLREISKNLFHSLHKMEKTFDIIISFKVENRDIGVAINDRLSRGAEWKVF